MQYDDFDVPEYASCEEYYPDGECIHDYPDTLDDVDERDLLDALMQGAPEWWLRRAEDAEPCCDRYGEAGADAGDLNDVPDDWEESA